MHWSLVICHRPVFHYHVIVQLSLRQVQGIVSGIIIYLLITRIQAGLLWVDVKKGSGLVVGRSAKKCACAAGAGPSDHSNIPLIGNFCLRIVVDGRYGFVNGLNTSRMATRNCGLMAASASRVCMLEKGPNSAVPCAQARSTGIVRDMQMCEEYHG